MVADKIMSIVTVSYNFSQFRVKVTPSMVLNDVLSQSLQHFRLLQENGGGKWGLTHNEKPVELDLPWRLMNLPTGVKLELKPLIDDGGDKIIKIRIQAPDYSSKVESVSVNANLKSFLQQLAQNANWPIQDPGAKLQFFTKTIPISELNDQTLKSLGIMESLSIRLILPSSTTTDASASMPIPAGTTPAREQEDTHRKVESRKIHQLHQVSAYIPSEKTIASQLNIQEENDDPELTVAHARRYQQMVLRQTGGLGGPMVPRRIKEQQEAAAARRKLVEECLVRVRFPDRTHIEVAFKNDDTMSTIYQIISSSLLNEQLQFKLYQSHPHVELPPSDQKLVEDLEFGSKTLLLFESNGKGPFLKGSILKDAKDLADADDVKLDRSDKVETNDQAEKQDLEPAQPEPKKSTPGKYPKWLKLSKK